MKLKVVISSLVVTLLTACAAQQGTTQQSASSAPAPAPAPAQQASNNGEATIIGTPAKGSKFAKLKIGMGRKEVEDLIGAPNDSHSYTTGKAFIPFYFGKDAVRFQTFYKGEGSLTYEGGGITGTSNTLIRVKVDTAERGYAHDD